MTPFTYIVTFVYFGKDHSTNSKYIFSVMKDLFVCGQFQNDDKLSLNRFAFIYLFIH